MAGAAVDLQSYGPTVAQSVAVFDFELIETSLEGAIRGTRPGVVTWRTFPDGLASYCDLPATERSEEVDCSWLGRVKRHWSTILDPRGSLLGGGPGARGRSVCDTLGIRTTSLPVGARTGVWSGRSEDFDDSRVRRAA